MKTETDKIKEKGSVMSPSVVSKSSKGGTAQLVDNRTNTVAQRKLKSGIDTSNKSNYPIQRKNKTGLPDALKSGVENLSGYSMDDVKVHYNSSKPAQLQAHAYAKGTDIHLAPGQEKNLPHEAWHVVQQKQGRVKPTMQFKGKVNINDDAKLEKEADVMGAKALKVKENTFQKDHNILNTSHKIDDGMYQRQANDQEKETELEADLMMPICGGKVSLYNPLAASREVAIYGHGVYSGGMFNADNRMTLRYFGPHKSITQGSLANSDSNGFRTADEINNQWHNYTLRKENAVASKKHEILENALRANRAIAVIERPTNTQEVITELINRGFTWALGIHCREVSGEMNSIFDVMSGNDVTKRRLVHKKGDLKTWWAFNSDGDPEKVTEAHIFINSFLSKMRNMEELYKVERIRGEWVTLYAFDQG